MLFPYSCQGGIMVFPWTNQGGNAESSGFSSLTGESFYFCYSINNIPVSDREGHCGQLGWYRGNLLLSSLIMGAAGFYIINYIN